MRAALLAITILLVALAVACGGDDDGDETDYTAEEIVEKVQAAVIQPGMVFHAKGDDGSEVWLDPGNQRFRRQESQARGGLTSIGEGWTRYSYDPFSNSVQTEDLSPGALTPRINDPVAPWWEPLTALAYGGICDDSSGGCPTGTGLHVIGETQADGKTVIAIEARSPVLSGDGGFSGNFLEGRIEIDPETWFPTAFEQREAVPTGGAETQPTPAQARIRYTNEIAPLENVPEGFFDRSIVEDVVLELHEHIQAIREVGLVPYWLGEEYVGQNGVVQLPETDNFAVSEESQTAEINYSFITPISQTQGEALENAVVISLAHSIDALLPPEVPEYAGEIPEQRQEVTARGGPAVVLTSILTPSDLPCSTGDCPATTAPLYRRIVFEIGDTAVQIAAFARVDATGADRNHFNSTAGLIELAEALTEAVAATPTPSAAP